MPSRECATPLADFFFAGGAFLLVRFLALVCLRIDVASKFSEFLVRRFFFFQIFVEKRNMLRLAQFFRKAITVP